MNRILLCSTLALGILLGAARPSHAADAAAIASAKKALQDAVNHGNAAGMLAARGQFDALSVADPKNPVLHYWVAVADWRVAPFLMGEADKSKGKRWVTEGIARASRASQLDPKFAEALALHSGLQGLYLQFEPGEMMKLGMGMGIEMNHATELAPRNPRVLLLDGISTLYKPGFVGGGADKALAKFEKAQELFAAENVTDAAAPDWGKDDAFVWAGRAASKSGDYERARGYFQKALVANPENGWVKSTLLPAVEKKLGEKKLGAGSGS